MFGVAVRLSCSRLRHTDTLVTSEFGFHIDDCSDLNDSDFYHDGEDDDGDEVDNDDDGDFDFATAHKDAKQCNGVVSLHWSSASGFQSCKP